MSVNNVLSLERKCIKFHNSRGNKTYLPEISKSIGQDQTSQRMVTCVMGVDRLISIIMYCGAH